MCALAQDGSEATVLPHNYSLLPDLPAVRCLNSTSSSSGWKRLGCGLQLRRLQQRSHTTLAYMPVCR